jgi:hypothetical protein
MSKGSRPRPFDIPKKQFDENYEKIFGKKSKDKKNDDNRKTN